MMAFWSLLVAIGTWTQDHQPLVLATAATLVLVLGAVRWSWRASSLPRRPRP